MRAGDWLRIGQRCKRLRDWLRRRGREQSRDRAVRGPSRSVLRSTSSVQPCHRDVPRRRWLQRCSSIDQRGAEGLFRSRARERAGVLSRIAAGTAGHRAREPASPPSSRSSRDGRAAEISHPPDRRAEIPPARRRHLHHRAVSRHRLADAADAGSRQRPSRHRSRVGARCQQGCGDSRISRPRARESSRRQAGRQRARLADGAAERRGIERRKRGVLPAHPCRHRLWLRRQPAVRTDADAAVETGRRPGCRVVG